MKLKMLLSTQLFAKLILLFLNVYKNSIASKLTQEQIVINLNKVCLRKFIENRHKCICNAEGLKLK